jgi:hypothetical protein
MTGAKTHWEFQRTGKIVVRRQSPWWGLWLPLIF